MDFTVGLVIGGASVYIYHIWILKKIEDKAFEEQAQLVQEGMEMGQANARAKKPKTKAKTKKKLKKMKKN